MVFGEVLHTLGFGRQEVSASTGVSLNNLTPDNLASLNIPDSLITNYHFEAIDRKSGQIILIEIRKDNSSSIAIRFPGNQMLDGHFSDESAQTFKRISDILSGKQQIIWSFRAKSSQEAVGEITPHKNEEGLFTTKEEIVAFIKALSEQGIDCVPSSGSAYFPNLNLDLVKNPNIPAGVNIRFVRINQQNSV